MTDPVPSKCIAAGCTNDAIGPSVLCMRHYVLPAGEPVPSKELFTDLSLLRASGFDDAADTIDRLVKALRGIQSCSTCEACRGAATRALGGAAPEPAAVLFWDTIVGPNVIDSDSDELRITMSFCRREDFDRAIAHIGAPPPPRDGQ